MEVFTLLIMVALLIEGIVETLKLIYDTSTRKVSIPVVLSLLVGMIVSFGLKLSILSALPLAGQPPDWLGYAVTGILISRGASFLHDLWGKLQTNKL